MWDVDHSGYVGVADFLLVITFLTALITFVVLARKHITKPLADWFQKQFAEAVRTTIQPDLDEIRKELTFNGGGSVKDMISQIQNELIEHIDKQKTVFIEAMQSLDMEGKTND